MAFSRLQLAAALIEYDNDVVENPYLKKDARRSAIFNHTRRPNAPGPSRSQQDDDQMYRQSSYSVAGTSGPRDVHGDRRSGALGMDTGRGSVVMDKRRGTMMSVPVDERDEEEELEDQVQEPHGEVDLASWGLPDEMLAKETPTQRDARVRARRPEQTKGMRAQSMRAQSMVGMEPLKYESESAVKDLRPLSPSVQDAISSMRATSPYVDPTGNTIIPRSSAVRDGRASRGARTVSFSGYPTDLPGSAAEDQMEELDNAARPRSSMSIMNRGRYDSLEGTRSPPKTRVSLDGRISVGSTPLGANVPLPASPAYGQFPGNSIYLESPQEEMPNPFALPAPAGAKVSRFDPKAEEMNQRRMSSGSMMPPRPDSRATGYFGQGADEEGRAPGRQPGSPNARGQPSRIDLLRPRTLIMPVPLQGMADPKASAPPPPVDRRGFTTGVKPLPPGALRPNSLLATLPSSRSLGSLTLSQKIFTSSLSVDGLHGEFFIGGAAEEGELGVQQMGGREVEYDDEGMERRRETGVDEDWRPIRATGGLSLMDKLEARKSALHGQRRVFTGDSRPTMMSRDSEARQSTLLSPNDPLSTPTDPSGRRKTLIDFAGDDKLSPTKSSPGLERPGNDRHKSVFGVDQIWKREIEKLKREEEADKVYQEQQLELEKSREKAKKRKSKGKSPALEVESGDLGHVHTLREDGAQDQLLGPHTSADIDEVAPPILPPIITAAEAAAAARAAKTPVVDVDDWAASDDERTPRKSKKKHKKKSKRRDREDQDDSMMSASQSRATLPSAVAGNESSEDDVPLTKAFKVTAQPIVRVGDADDESSEDEPLSKIASKHQAPVLPKIEQGLSLGDMGDGDDGDDVPLAVRRMTMLSMQPSRPDASADEEDDDVPLGQRHSMAASQRQQRQSMMIMQQQQQMFQQQQQRQSMFPNPMGGYPMPNMGMPMMGMPMMNPYMGMGGMTPSMVSFQQPVAPTPPNPAIDRWRREVELREGSVKSGSGQSVV